MKNMFKKNKVLFLAVIIVLAGGICLAAVLISQANVAMAAGRIITAEAEAADTVAAEAPEATPTPDAAATPQPSAINTTLSAESLSHLVELKEMRREYIIPSLDNTVVNEADTWETTEPDDYEALKAKALSEASIYTKAFFGFVIAEDAADFYYFTDTSGNRADFIRVFTTDEAVVCTLAADTLDLIEIDYYFIPSDAVDESNQLLGEEFKTIPDSHREIADSIAAVFDTTVSDIDVSGGCGSGWGVWTKTYSLKMENGRLVEFSIMNDTLYAVGVYPSEACLQERVYFEADVQWNQSVIELASPKDFKKGEPGTGDMTRDEALQFYMSFMKLANGDGEYDAPKMTFYIDNSGTRENYWHMEDNKMTMDVASKSKYIVSLTCDNLYSTVRDLTAIGYDDMGGEEYADYVANIMRTIYGDGFKEASTNAVYDYHYCTEDAWMADGSVYEFMFEDGKLQQVFFYADEDCFYSALCGWKADNEYINTTTGETFVPS